MKTTKTFNELIAEHGRQALFLGLIDQASEDAVVDFFGDRHVTDDNKAVLYFTRNLKRYADQYNNLLRIETIKFDPLVTKYLEEQDKYKTDNARTKTDSAKDSTTQTRLNNGTVTVKTDSTTTDDATTASTLSGTDTQNNTNVVDRDTTGSATDTIRTRDLHSDTPHSDVSSVTTGGLMNSVNWKYASGLDDHGEDSTHSTNGTEDVTTTDNGTTTTSQTGSGSVNDEVVVDGTQVTTKADGYTLTDTKEKTGSTGETDKKNEEKTKRLTGRDGSPQELLDKARNYIKGTLAMDTLLGELEICFMPDLLYGEEW